MASIVPAPPASPATPNYQQNFDRDVPLYTVPAGTTLYGRNLGSWLYFGAATFRNAGAIFYDIDASYVGTTRFAPNNGITTVENSGSIVVRGTATGAGTVNNIQLFDEIRGFTNSGQIWGVTTSGAARLVQSYYQDVTIVNSGLMAVQAAGFAAIGISLPNGGRITNTATGVMLAEGKTAAAVRIDFSAVGNVIELTNAGRIEARGTEGTAGIGVILILGDLVNSGSVSGEIAVAGSSPVIVNSGMLIGTQASITASEAVTLTNQASGVVTGRIEGGNREDRITNAGMIDGGIRTYDGNDTITNTASARITGIVDLGLGDDRYTGSDGSDRVAPDNGADVLDGAGGNDLLLGGNGNDRLIGGAGNDGLYGENGDDVILVEGGDEAFGGRDADRFELADLRFARIDGGDGTDTVVLPGGGLVFDLSAALAAGRIVGVEAYELRGGQEIVVRAADVAAGASLRIDATTTDRVALIGGWSAGATENGYVRYTLGTSTVLVTSGATVSTSASIGATGLDVVAGGDPALRPGAASGVDLTPDNLYVSYVEIYEPTTIPTTDFWYTIGKLPALWAERGSGALTVQGTLLATNDAQATAIAADLRNGVRVVVEGSVGAESTGAVERPVPDYFPVSLEGAYAIRAALSVVSTGYIGAYSLKGMAVALGEVQIVPALTAPMPGGGGSIPQVQSVRSAISTIDNRGVIEARADAGWAVGAVGAGEVRNAGEISVIGVKGAIGLIGSGVVVNSGSIVVASDGPALGVILQPSDKNYTVTNSGYVEADTAILVDFVTSSGQRVLTLDNVGTIRGDIQSGNAADGVTNSRTIDGVTRLAGGNDRFDGSAGTQGAVYGDAGNDVLIGGVGSDVLAGGAGDDVLTGGGGTDTAVFGGTLTDYRFTFGDDVITVVSTAEGTDRLNGIEAFRIGATTYTLAELKTALAPALPPEVLRASPGDGALGVSPVGDIRILFAGPVGRGSGVITLARADGTVVETFAADSARVAVSGNVLTIDPTRALAAGTGYFVSVAAGALTIGGTSFGGFTGYDFTTAAASAGSDFQLLVGDGLAATVSGSGTVFGIRGTTQDVTVRDAPGLVTFDPSFNAGGDRIRVSGAAGDYTAVRSGSTVLLSDGDTIVAVPVGPASTDILFADGIRTLLLDTVAGAAKIGGQTVTTTATVLGAPAGPATATGAAAGGAGVLLQLNEGASATVLGAATVLGSRGGAESVTVASGASVVFDASFNAGRDVIALPGDAASYTAQRSGSSIVLRSATETITLPVGVTGATLRFDDAERSIVFDTAAGAVKLGAQVIGATAVTVAAPLAPSVVALTASQSALGGDYRYTHAGDATPDSTITGFARGDSLALTGDAARYIFGGQGGDVTISYVGADGAVRTTTIVGVADPAVWVHDLASAQAAVGFGLAG